MWRSWFIGCVQVPSEEFDVEIRAWEEKEGTWDYSKALNSPPLQRIHMECHGKSLTDLHGLLQPHHHYLENVRIDLDFFTFNMIYKTTTSRFHVGNANSFLFVYFIPCKECDRDFLMSIWRQFGWEWGHVRRKSAHFLGVCHENSRTWPPSKSMSRSSIKNK